MKKWLGKLVALSLVSILGMGAIAGCGQTAPETPPPAPPAAAPSAPVAPAESTPSVMPAPQPAGQAGTTAPPAAASAFPLTITDELGRTVTIRRMPERILPLAPSNTEIVYALGLGDKVVARTNFDDFPSQVTQKPSVGGYTNPNLETLVSLAPDLILTTAVHQREITPKLEAMGYTVVGLDPKTIDDVLVSINLVGEITGETQAASELTAALQKRIDAVTERTGKLTAAQRPKTFYIVWPDPLMSAGTGTFQADLIQKAGGTNIAQSLDGWKQISPEDVVSSNPEIMVAGSMANAHTNFDFLKSRPEFAGTDARRAGKVYEVDGNLISRPGPRLVDALEEFARTLHPELFGVK
jgi:iron complex transport system substrate-binding protein